MRNDIFNGKKNIINKRENNYQNELIYEKLREQESKSLNDSKKKIILKIKYNNIIYIKKITILN